ncbi:DHA2 family efflux MFS transporter permease subunit [Lacticaseibacillus saniviri]|uniref:Major facilitator superfamily (MFS) profile domain-containing protein n=2 Tax=Lacticaseibacillus saniviri TaxID=931533 RepID=A0A0R2MNB2_9LACO|nr:DHA2 family efflux MFS transporter permease subunit [Lacticaseibacillus saniviri]KRO15192.1 hypothetical protein IV56_GL000283 [Lacticaseibacillus saniviri JCM 17471 = DSM 24301]
MNAKKRNLIAIILLVTAFVALLNQTLMITALPVMAKTLHISLNLAQWLTAGYVLTVGLITPISANLIEKFTSRQIFLSIVLVFILGTLIGPLTNNFAIILLGRLIQAAAGGVLVTFVMVSMISLYAPEQRGLVMGYVSLVISAGPAIGPTLSGLIMNFYPWQALFYLILPIMILAFIAGWLWLPNYTEKHATTIDVRSVISSILGIGLIMSSISIFAQNVLLASAMLVIGIIATLYFIRRQFNLKTPLLDLNLFKQPSFSMMIVSLMLIFAILMGTEALIPVYVENVLHHSSLIAGLVMLPGAFANAITAPIVGRFYDRYGVKWPLLIGSGLLVVSSLPFFWMTAQTSLWWLGFVYIVRMIGVSMMLSTVTTESLSDLPLKSIGYGTALNNTLRQISGSAANTILIMVSLIPAQLLSGYRLSMGIIFVGVILVTVIVAIYVMKYGKEPHGTSN